MRFFRYDWWSDNIPDMISILMPIAGKENLLFLEIGSFEGMSTLWFLDNILTHQTSRIHVIDTFEGSEEHKEAGLTFKGVERMFRRNTAHRASKITVHVGRSQEILKGLPLVKDFRSFDCIYVDGSHIAVDVMSDAMMSWPLLKAGGILVFDDYAWGDNRPEGHTPRPAIDSFLRLMTGYYDLLFTHYRVAIRKKPPLPQPIR